MNKRNKISNISLKNNNFNFGGEMTSTSLETSIEAPSGSPGESPGESPDGLLEDSLASAPLLKEDLSINNNTRKMPKMVLWDFDLTLTKFHTYYAGYLSAEKVDELTPNYIRKELFADFEFLKETIQNLRVQNVKVGIVTFQFEEVVQKLFDKAYESKEENPFNDSNILGRLFIFNDKLSMVKHLVNSNNLTLDENDVWVFDDDIRNLKKIDNYSKKNGMCLKTFHVNDKKHFVRSEYTSIFEKNEFVEDKESIEKTLRDSINTLYESPIISKLINSSLNSSFDATLNLTSSGSLISIK